MASYAVKGINLDSSHTSETGAPLAGFDFVLFNRNLRINLLYRIFGVIRKLICSKAEVLDRLCAFQAGVEVV
jgi:hypothetical protein